MVLPPLIRGVNTDTIPDCHKYTAIIRELPDPTKNDVFEICMKLIPMRPAGID